MYENFEMPRKVSTFSKCFQRNVPQHLMYQLFKFLTCCACQSQIFCHKDPGHVSKLMHFKRLLIWAFVQKQPVLQSKMPQVKINK